MDPGPRRPATRASLVGSGGPPARRPLHVDDAVAAPEREPAGHLGDPGHLSPLGLGSRRRDLGARCLRRRVGRWWRGGTARRHGGLRRAGGRGVRGRSGRPRSAPPELSAPACMANRLATQSSPYLRQHDGNPVDWYTWGEEAMRAAREADRPILLSIGYSACHWCHVMAHECFEDAGIAALMNPLFVNIKVDREERPDVDAVYMEAVQAMTGQGGWPMTVFLTPDGAPYFGGTYFPPVARGGMPAFPAVLRAAHDAYRDGREDVERIGSEIRRALPPPPLPAGEEPSAEVVTRAV